MKLTAAARRQVADLRRHFRETGRVEALLNLSAALRDAPRLVAQGRGRPAPRPYPDMAVVGRAWVHAGPYWIAYSLSGPGEITAVMFDRANIPGRA